MGRIWDEGFGDLGDTTAEGVITALSKGTQDVVRSIGETKSKAYRDVITAGAVSAGVLVVGVVAGVLVIKAVSR